MQLIDGRPVYAATDLVAYLACEHLTQLERAALAGLVKRPMRDDPELDIIRKRGFEHERRFLADLRVEGRTAMTIRLDGSIEDDGERLRAAAAETVAAMVAGRASMAQTERRSGATVGVRAMALRGRRHEARPACQGQRRPPDLHLRGPARRHPAGESRMDARRPWR